MKTRRAELAVERFERTSFRRLHPLDDLGRVPYIFGAFIAESKIRLGSDRVNLNYRRDKETKSSSEEKT
jgi:hypothetical protein